MPRPKIFSTRPLFDAARQILQEKCEVEYWSQPDRITREELFGRVKDKDGLVCLLTERVDDQLLRGAAKLRMVANVAVGFDNIDVPACTKRKVAVTQHAGRAG